MLIDETKCPATVAGVGHMGNVSIHRDQGEAMDTVMVSQRRETRTEGNERIWIRITSDGSPLTPRHGPCHP
jgi:hypothetical protein